MGELAVGKYLLEKNWKVFFSLSGVGKTDLVAQDPNGILQRIQVKSTTRKSGTKWKVDLNTNRRNNTKKWIDSIDLSKLDYIAVYVIPEDRVVMIPVKEITTKSYLTVESDLPIEVRGS